MFEVLGSFDPEICDHGLVYGILCHGTKKKQSHSEVSKMLSDFDELNKDLANAPWNVLEIYDSIDEQYSNWKTTCIFERV